MKIVQINTFSNKSTGTIMMSIHKRLQELGHDSYVVWGRGRNSNNEHEIYLNDKFGVMFHGIFTRLTDKTGFASKKSTKQLIKRLDQIKPDIIHLHNIHGYYINIKMLFNYIKMNNIRVIWTLHDCWSFTGHCPHFELIGCEKWKNGGCHNCSQKNVYPKSMIDNSKYNYEKKKELFNGINNMTIVTPSKWLANLVKKSFLKEYEVNIINNGIDTSIFKPRKSDFREKYNLIDKKIILGVASDWTKEKGYNDFIELSKNIGNSYKIVMVGLNDKQLKEIPSSIIGIKRTENAIQLAEIYSAADVYFNPTYADTYPTTNLESISCGTPVCTYNTGGSVESINRNTGMVITIGNYYDILNKIKVFENLKRKKSLSTKLDNKVMIENYIKLYE